MLQEFQAHIESNLPFLSKSKLLVAISGGLDSVVLTHLCSKIGLNIALAHCNFQLRGEESDADEQFVIDLAENLEVDLYVEYFETASFAKEHKLSIQMAARALRYEWFEALKDDLNFDYVLTAHHADDNLETFLINLTRGSGISGLIGIPEVNDFFVRPLLPFGRAQLENYASLNKLQWREDSSNAKDDYLRNKLRHHIIPQLKEIAPELLANFKKIVSNLSDTADIVDESLNAVAKRAIVDIDEHQIKFKVSEFVKVNNPKAYLFEMFKDYGFTEWNDVNGLLTAQTGKQVLSDTHRLIKDRKHLILTNRSDITAPEFEPITISKIDDMINTPFGIMSIEDVEAVDKTSKTGIFIDRNKLKFPLVIRTWKKGDVFYPIGMKGKKKLSKYFKDEKLSLVEKENIKLLTSEGNIVWIIGKRADDRFKVTKNTTQILKIELNSQIK